MAGEKGTTEDEMVGGYHRLDGRECEEVPGVVDGQGSLTCCSPVQFIGSVLSGSLLTP